MNLFQNQSPCDEKAEEHLSLSEEMLVSAARAGQDWAFVELCSRIQGGFLLRFVESQKMHRTPKMYFRSQY